MIQNSPQKFCIIAVRCTLLLFKLFKVGRYFNCRDNTACDKLHLLIFQQIIQYNRDFLRTGLLQRNSKTVRPFCDVSEVNITILSSVFLPQKYFIVLSLMVVKNTDLIHENSLKTHFNFLQRCTINKAKIRKNSC